jgi:hypothetical protein
MRLLLILLCGTLGLAASLQAQTLNAVACNKVLAPLASSSTLHHIFFDRNQNCVQILSFDSAYTLANGATLLSAPFAHALAMINVDAAGTVLHSALIAKGNGAISGSAYEMKRGDMMLNIDFNKAVEIQASNYYDSLGDVLLVRVDSNYAIKWHKKIGTSGGDAISALCESSISDNFYCFISLDINRPVYPHQWTTYSDVMDTIDMSCYTNIGYKQMFLATFNQTGNLLSYKHFPVHSRSTGISSYSASDSLLISFNLEQSTVVLDSITYNFSNIGSTLGGGCKLSIFCDSLGSVDTILAIQGKSSSASGPMATLLHGGSLEPGLPTIIGRGFVRFCDVRLVGQPWIFGLMVDEACYLVSYSKKGVISWVHTFTGDNNGYSFTAFDKKFGIYAAGYKRGFSTISDTILLSGQGPYIAKFDSSGRFQWVKAATGLAAAKALQVVSDTAVNWLVSCDAGFTIDGFTAPTAGIYYIKLRNWATDLPLQPAVDNGLQVFPNPSTGIFYVSNEFGNLSFISIDGTVQPMQCTRQNAVLNKVVVPDAEAGVYIVQAYKGGKLYTLKFVITK